MARSKLPVTLTAEQRDELNRMVKSSSMPQKLVRRARIVQLAAAGQDNRQIALRLKTSCVTVGLWRQRFIDLGIAGLEEAPRPGRPGKQDPAKIRRALSEVIQPPQGCKRWSCRSMARHVGLSKDAVQRLWAANGIKPPGPRAVKLSTDRKVEQRFWDVIGLYLDPPTRAIVLCCEEKSHCQDGEQTQPRLPAEPGHIEPRTDDDYHRGTITLFAAFSYLADKFSAKEGPSHRHQEWMAFLKSIDQEMPAGIDIHLILNNHATRMHPKVRAWLAKHLRFYQHFPPIGSSWQSLIERFFHDLSHGALLPGSLGNMKELVDGLLAYLAECHLEPVRYQWRAKRQSL